MSQNDTKTGQNYLLNISGTGTISLGGQEIAEVKDDRVQLYNKDEDENIVTKKEVKPSDQNMVSIALHYYSQEEPVHNPDAYLTVEYSNDSEPEVTIGHEMEEKDDNLEHWALFLSEE